MRCVVLSLLLVSTLSLAASARAQQLTLLDEAHLASGESSGLTPPVIDDVTGAIYWRKYIDFTLGGFLLKVSPGGVIAMDEPIPGDVGDFPLAEFPSDAHAGDVLLIGRFVVANVGFGNAIYAYPGLGRIAYYGSTFPGFTSDPSELQILLPALYDGEGGIVFPMRRLAGPVFRYAICRTAGSGDIEILASTDTTIVPGGDGGLFTLMNRTIPSGDKILFYGEGGGRRGVYQLEGGVVTTVVDNGTVLPPNVAPATLFNAQDVNFAIDGTDVAIVLTDIGGGVWKRVGGQWSRVIAINAAIPGGTGLMFDLGRVAIREGVVVFAGGRNNQFAPPLQSGFYTDASGVVAPIVNLETDYGADVPTRFEVYDGGRWFDGAKIAFAAEGVGWRALYSAPVPEPSSAIVGAISLATLAAIRRGRISS